MSYEEELRKLQARAAEAKKKLAEMTSQKMAETVVHTGKSLSSILAEQQKAAERAEAPTIVVPSAEAHKQALLATSIGSIDWNEKQSQAITFGLQGKSFVLIGAAGTGKTTTLKGVVQHLLTSHLIPPLTSSSKYLMTGTPGIVLVSYTRRAVRQISRQMIPELRAHCLTIHRLLEFEPVVYEYEDAEGKIKKTMRFEPARTMMNPLPNVRVCVVDESSMVQNDPLFQQLRDALPRNCIFIFLGDLHQLPPVYGESVLPVKLQELPIVELTEVYRQALDSPIIRLATDIKNGIDIPVKEKIKWTSPDGKSNVVINPWPKKVSTEDAMDGLAGTIKNVIKTGNFNEEEDVILMPHNVGCGTIELNLHIANTLGIQRGATVHHVIAGFQHWYLAIGDRVLVDKQDCIIRGIEKNAKYSGKIPMEPATSLDRWGTYQDEKTHHLMEESNEDIDDLLERMSEQNVDDKQNQASHVLVLESLDTGREWRVSEVGTYNGMVFSYALTVHKSQGSEWRRVFLFLHSSHHAMCSRELVYTAVTRAREDLIIICEPDRVGAPGTLTKAARNPRIKGNTLAEKLEWLRANAAEKLKKQQSKEGNLARTFEEEDM